MAARSGFQGGETPQRPHGDAHVGRSRESIDALSKWSFRRCRAVCSSDQFLDVPLSRAPSLSSSLPTPSLIAFSADVADHWILVATIVQHAREQGCWEGVDFAVESAAARVCQEAGGRVAVNVMVRDMDLALPNAHDARRLEVLVDGFAPAWRSANWRLTPLWCLPFGAMGLPDLVPRTSMASSWPRPGAEKSVHTRSWSVAVPRRGWRQVVGGDANVPPHFGTREKRAKQAWRIHWAATLACSAARAFAASILDLRVGGGADGDVPRSHDVANDFRHTCASDDRGCLCLIHESV